MDRHPKTDLRPRRPLRRRLRPYLRPEFAVPAGLVAVAWLAAVVIVVRSFLRT